MTKKAYELCGNYDEVNKIKKRLKEIDESHKLMMKMQKISLFEIERAILRKRWGD